MHPHVCGRWLVGTTEQTRNCRRAYLSSHHPQDVRTHSPFAGWRRGWSELPDAGPNSSHPLDVQCTCAHEEIQRLPRAATAGRSAGRGRSGPAGHHRAERRYLSPVGGAPTPACLESVTLDRDPRFGSRGRELDVGVDVRRSDVQASPAAVILLDTNALFWVDQHHPRARGLLRAGTVLYVSPASLLELQLLREVGRSAASRPSGDCGRRTLGTGRTCRLCVVPARGGPHVDA